MAKHQALTLENSVRLRVASQQNCQRCPMKYDMIEVDITNSKINEKEYKESGWELYSVRIEGNRTYVTLIRERENA